MAEIKTTRKDLQLKWLDILRKEMSDEKARSVLDQLIQAEESRSLSDLLRDLIEDSDKQEIQTLLDLWTDDGVISYGTVDAGSPAPASTASMNFASMPEKVLQVNE